MGDIVFSLTKHQNGYEKDKGLVLQCPLKFNSTVQTGDCECTKMLCAWWMMQQRACAVNVQARAYGYIQSANKQ